MRKTGGRGTTTVRRRLLEGLEMNRRVGVLVAGVLFVLFLAVGASAQTTPGGVTATPPDAQVQQQGAAADTGAGGAAVQKTPQAAVDYINMMKARAALRDRAAAMREQVIQRELGGQAPEPAK